MSARDEPLEGATLALDQGGQSSRAIVFDASGRAVRAARRPVAETRPGPGRVEQDAEELVRSLVSAAREALAGLPPGAVTRAGLATQRSSVVCWDRETGAALTPVLSWQDVRAADRLEPLAARRAELRRITGLYPNAHYGATKLAWCLEHVPAVRAARDAGRRACGPLASFLLFRLVREHTFAVDPANASRTLLFDLATRDWSPALLEAFDVPRGLLPRCVPTRSAFGTLEGGIPLVVVQGDQPAALFAWGEPREDTLYVNVGTGAFLQRPLGIEGGAPPPLERLLASVVLSEDGAPVRTVVEGTVNGAGGALAWFAESAGLDELERDLPTWLAEVREPPLFLGGASGLGSPFWAELAPRFVGDEGADDRARAVAVVESVVFLVLENLAAMAERLPPPARIVVSGGLANLDGLCARLAALAGARVERPAVREATAQGVAYLSSGVVPPDEEPADVFEPDGPWLGELRERYERWRAELARALEKRR